MATFYWNRFYHWYKLWYSKVKYVLERNRKNKEGQQNEASPKNFLQPVLIIQIHLRASSYWKGFGQWRVV